MISLSAARALTGELTLVTNAGRRNRHPPESIFARRRLPGAIRGARVSLQASAFDELLTRDFTPVSCAVPAVAELAAAGLVGG